MLGDILDEDEFARALLAKERRDWQDPESILDQIDIRRGSNVADLGCGPGFFTIPIVRRIQPNGLVYAVDSSSRMLDYLRSNIRKSRVNPKSVRIIESDATGSSIPSNSVDVVLVANILHDIEDKKQFLRETIRISKPSSILVDLDWVTAETPVGPPLEIRLEEKDARKLIQRAGYLVTRNIDAGPYHYGLLCNRD